MQNENRSISNSKTERETIFENGLSFFMPFKEEKIKFFTLNFIIIGRIQLANFITI